ncbi:MAG: hypothetical protein PHV30_07940 [Candidatus Margulisbacteria bacterium]|nr:hypothetical protein [Candidatus Margulisiibacteriota bacterium]
MLNKIISLIDPFPWLAGKAPTIGLIFSSHSRLNNILPVIDNMARDFGIPLIRNGFGSLLQIVIGGDGTNIATVRQMPDLQVPVFGIKGGTYNAAPLIEADKVSATLKNFLANKYSLAQRNLFSIGLPLRTIGHDRYGDLILGYRSRGQETRLRVINEVVLNYIGDSPLRIEMPEAGFNFRGNGFLLCTALGSTAENFSYQGLEIPYDHSGYVFTPIAPYRRLDAPTEREAVSGVIELGSKQYIEISYLRQSFYVKHGLKLHIDNRSPIFIPRSIHGKELTRVKIPVYKEEPWRTIRPVN